MVLILLALACTPPADDTDDDTAPADDTAPVDDTAPETDDTDEPVDTGPEGPPPLRINELMAANQRTIQDARGQWADWIELFNPTDAPVNLGGWTMSDDAEQPDTHTLHAALEVPAGGFLLLWADGDPDEGPDHLDFNLAAEGESVALFAPVGSLVDRVDFGALPVDVAAARTPDGAAAWTLTDAPTPGASNGEPR